MKQFCNRPGQCLVLALILTFALIGTAGATENSKIVRSDASESQLALINELWGKDITVLEYMKIVHPEHLAGVPEPVLQTLADQKMNWWEIKPEPGGSTPADKASVSVSAIGYKLDYRTIRFGGSCAAFGLSNPPSYIYVEAFLINSGTGQTVDSTAASAQNQWSVTALKDKLNPASGNYYVHAWGYIPSPNYAEGSADTNVFGFP